MRPRIVLVAGLLGLALLAGLLVAGIYQDPPDRPPSNPRPGKSSTVDPYDVNRPERP